MTDVNERLQCIAVNLQSPFETEKVTLFCDSACNQSWISENSAEKSECARHTFETYSSRIQLTSYHLHLNCRADAGSFGWLLPGFCGQTIYEERPKRCCRFVTSPVSVLRAYSPEEVQLWRCRNDP